MDRAASLGHERARLTVVGSQRCSTVVLSREVWKMLDCCHMQLFDDDNNTKCSIARLLEVLRSLLEM